MDVWKYAKLRRPWVSRKDQFFVLENGEPVTAEIMRNLLKEIIRIWV